MQVSGLSSGLDTAGIIQQLMSVERMSGKGLTTGKTKAQSLLSAFQSLNGLVKSFQDAAKVLTPNTTLKTSVWASTSATSSNPELATVTTGANAAAGSLTFTVNNVAKPGAVISSSAFAGDVAVASDSAGFSLSLTVGGGAPQTISVPEKAKMADVVKAINDADLGVRATMIQVSPDQYRLQAHSTSTGSATNLTLSGGPFGAFDVLSKGEDAEITLGEGTTGVKITSPTNTLKDIVPGLSITVVKDDATTPMTVAVKSDVYGIASKVKAMVDAANQVLDNIRSNSSYDAATKKGGVLLGDATTRQIQSTIARFVVGDVTSNAALTGVSLDKNGKVTFDEAKFTAAYAKDPVAIEKALTETAKNLADVGKQATNPTDGWLTVRIRGQEDSLKDYTTQIAKFEGRMSLRQSVLERQFAALESMLSKLQAQGNWLAGQLKALPTASSSSD